MAVVRFIREKRQDTLKGREQAKPAFNPQPDTLPIVMGWGMPVPSAGLFTVLTRHCLSFFVPLSLPARTLVEASEKLLTCLFVCFCLTFLTCKQVVSNAGCVALLQSWAGEREQCGHSRAWWLSLQLLLMGLAPALLALSPPQPGLPPAILCLTPAPASAPAVPWPQHFPCPRVSNY